MKTALLALGGVVCALSQGPVAGTQTGAAGASRPAQIQQASQSRRPTWHEEQDCLEEARQIARNGPRRSANVSHAQLLAFADELCAE